jgi:hypothetical protein
LLRETLEAGVVVHRGETGVRRRLPPTLAVGLSHYLFVFARNESDGIEVTLCCDVCRSKAKQQNKCRNFVTSRGSWSQMVNASVPNTKN